jgi:hypothetical protein
MRGVNLNHQPDVRYFHDDMRREGSICVSDVGTLSYEYQQATKLAHKLEQLLDQARRGGTERELRLQVALALEGLIGLLDPLSEDAEHGDAAMHTPIGLVRRLRSQQFEGTSYSDALKHLRQRLVDPVDGLEENDLRLLDELTGATEHEVAATFRRMVRR